MGGSFGKRKPAQPVREVRVWLRLNGVWTLFVRHDPVEVAKP
jgi:hypothetical protein